MFAYTAIHLLNHALGIFSLALAESGLRAEMAFWRSTSATLLLYGAAAMHFSLALWTLHKVVASGGLGLKGRFRLQLSAAADWPRRDNPAW